MSNARAKGRRYELKMKEMLEADGWEVELVKGGTGWQKSTDFFGWADVIAIHPKRPITLLAQCKGGKRWYLPSKAERALIARYTAFGSHIRCEWWAWRDRVKEPRIMQL